MGVGGHRNISKKERSMDKGMLRSIVADCHFIIGTIFFFFFFNCGSLPLKLCMLQINESN